MAVKDVKKYEYELYEKLVLKNIKILLKLVIYLILHTGTKDLQMSLLKH